MKVGPTGRFSPLLLIVTFSTRTLLGSVGGPGGVEHDAQGNSATVAGELDSAGDSATVAGENLPRWRVKFCHGGG